MEFWILAAGLTSLALGGAMTLLAANVVQQNHRREVARRALLSRMAFPGGMPAEAVTDPLTDAGELFRVDEFRRKSSVPTETLFSEPQPSGAASRRTAALASVSLAFAIVIGATTVSVPSPVQTAPHVELLSLTDRATPAAFLVTGQVRNPAGGTPLNDVVAVVEVMDGAGRVLMTVRAPLKRRELSAGEDSEFLATASKATNVARYRVKFQDTARVVIPHVDRRQQPANSRPG